VCGVRILSAFGAVYMFLWYRLLKTFCEHVRLGAIYGSVIGNNGAAAVATALRVNRTLTFLDLSGMWSSD